MIAYLWSAIGLVAVAFLVYRGGRIWLDAARHGFDFPQRIRWAISGAFHPSSYWWDARISALSPEEAQDLVSHEIELLCLGRADSLRCPLCEAEVPVAWTLTPGGKVTVAPGPVECPNCDFRLDACRHCTHFLPGELRGWGAAPWDRIHVTSGRCSRHKTLQPVELTTTPDMARRMAARGLTHVRAPMRIVDSYFPPDSCRAFQPARQQIKDSQIRWPDARRTALLRLLASPPHPRPATKQRTLSDDEQWLL
jgi:hypothetical protein